MKQSLKSGIPEFDEAVEQFENGEINFVELTSRLWNRAYKIGQTEQCNIANVSQRYTIEDIERCVENWGLCKVEKEYIEKFLNGG